MFRQRRMEWKSPPRACAIPKMIVSVTAITVRMECCFIRRWTLSVRRSLLLTSELLTSIKGFFVHDIWHLRRIAAIISLQNVNEPLDAAAGHAFVGINIEPRNSPAAGEVMKYAAAIHNLGIEQRRVWREWFLFKDIECGAGDDFFFQRFRQRFFVHHRAA